MLSIHVGYAKYLFYHKLYVGQECFKRRLYLRGVLHDWDKFLPGRWMAYANYFNSKEVTPEIKEAFGTSWRRHAYLNDHHWQHWVSISDSGGKDRSGRVVPHEMADAARREMLADWIGAHKVTGGHDLYGWYTERKVGILLAPKTRQWLEAELEKLRRH